MASKTKQDTQIEKLYHRLIEEPEKGVVEKKYTVQDGKKVHSGYAPTLEQFTVIIHQKMSDEGMFPPGENYSWAYKLSVIKKTYGFGPSVNYGDERNRDYEKKDTGNKPMWWQKENAHLSPDSKYYVVPLVFENMLNNPNLAEYKDTSGKLEVGHPAPKGSTTGRGLLGNQDFIDKCKIWALDKLQKDLDKEIKKDNFKEWADDFGLIPQNKKVKRSRDQETGNPREVSLTQSWHIIPRRPDYQTLWIKIMFDRGWVDSLPGKNLKVDMSKVQREVLILVKDFKQNLDNLENVLLHFDAQMTIAFAEEGFEVNFDAKCSANSIKQIYQVIDGLLRANSISSLEDIKNTNPLAALQFGFSKDYILQYVSFSEVADCLCEEGADLTPYILKEGLLSIRGSGPFSVPRINNFIHLLPAINRRYSKYLKAGGNYSTDLFSMHQSWLDFINTYIYPTPETNYNGNASGPGLMTAVDLLQLKNPIYKDLLFTGKYIKDPLNTMSPDVKNAIAGASNITNMYAGDDNLLKAMFGEISSMSELFDKLLNRIPITELIKIASQLMFKCVKNSDLKRHLCQKILQNISIAEIRQQLYPCLRNLPDGELAIAKLEEKITGRVNELYKVAAARYPDKFFLDPAEALGEAQFMSKVVPLYCADPYMQNKLGRSPDDFNEEFMKWADEAASDAICDCVLTLYGPVTKFLEDVQEISDEMVDGMTTASKEKLYENDQQGALALDKFVDPIKRYLKSEDKMASIKKTFSKGLKDVGMSLVYATAMVVLKYVKEQFSGNIMKDLCNSKESPFGFSSPKEWIMNSQVYRDKGENELWDKFKDLKAKHFFNQDIQTLVDGFEKMGDIFSPRELKKMFTTECGDTSFEGSYEDAALAFMDEGTIAILQMSFPGLSLAAIAAQIGYDPTKKNQSYEKKDPITGLVAELPFPIGFISPIQAQAFLLDLGNLIDFDMYDIAISEYDAMQAALTGLCDPINVDQLANSIFPEDIIALTEGDQQQVLNDIDAVLPFMDGNMMQNLYPPLFCGPCAPDQVGMKPLMPSQTHETQLFMQNELITKTYKSIDDAFNNNLSVYKPMIKEVFSPLIMQTLLNSINSGENPSSDGGAGASEVYMSAVTNMLNLAREQDDADKDGDGNRLVAKKFRDIVSKLNNVGTTSEQLIIYKPEDGVGVFNYELPNSAYTMKLVFNFSGNPISVGEVTVLSPQIKIISYNAGVKEYEYPTAASDEEGLISEFNMTDISTELFDYFEHSESSVVASMLMLLSATGPTTLNMFKGIYPLISNSLLEVVWGNASQTELFKASNFNSMPLTNQEAQSKCLDTNPTPLLNPEKNKSDVEDIRKSLECMVSMFDTPDAVQIANMFGLYKMLIKVCVVEEFLKNIFMFSFAKISDTIEDEAYMNIVRSSVKSSLESILSTGYEYLLQYSQKIVNARRANIDIDALTDDDGNPLSKEKKAEETKIKTPEESLNILIEEVAVEIDDLLDDRVRKYANKEWKDKFTKLEETDYFKNDFFKYAIQDELMVKSRYPAATLAAGKMPIFADVDGITPLPTGKEGGLFFEPYTRLKSKLITDYVPPNSLEEADPYFQNFWKKFKEAFFYWENSVFMAYDDPNAYGSLGNLPGQKVKSLPFPAITGAPLNNTFFTRASKSGGGYTNENVLYKTILPEPGHLPIGSQQSYGSTNSAINKGAAAALDDNYDVVRKIHNFIRKVIKKIDDEYEEKGSLLFENGDQDLSTFWDFFLTFFSPVDKEGNPTKNTNYYTPLFTYLVSSLEPNTPPSSSEPRFWDAFYYWQNYPGGIVPDAGANFQNRGVVNLSTVGFYNTDMLGGYDFQKQQGSIVDVFSAAKETNIGFTQPEFVVEGLQDSDDPLSWAWAEFWDPEEEDDEEKEKKGDALKNGLNQNVDQVRKIAEFMQRHGFEYFNGVLDGPVADTFLKENIDYLCGTYEWLKRVVIEAPFDHWFDISLGMRLNLVVPYAGPDIKSDYLKNLISTIRDTTPYLDNIKIDRDYMLDKTFLLGEPEGNLKGKQWLCLPVELEEHDLRKYWEDIHAATTPATIAVGGDLSIATPTEFGISSISSALLDSKDPMLKENPWSLIMGGISELGLNSGALQYNFDRGYNINKESNLYNNLFVPLNFHLHYVKDSAMQNTYYVNLSTLENPVRPTLWTVFKLLNTTLSAHNRNEEDPKNNVNPLREEVIYTLQNKIMQKLKDSKLLNEILPIKQTTFTTALIYRYAMLSAYPKLIDFLSPTKNLINSFIAASLKAIEEDYSYVKEEEVTQEEKLNTSSPGPQDIAMMFFELVIQMAANTVDPTWKTAWFFPGPLTPVGIIAKLLAKEPDDDDGKKSEEEECKPKPPSDPDSTMVDKGSETFEVPEPAVDAPEVPTDPSAEVGLPGVD